MRIEGLVWLDAVVEKLAVKHRVSVDEVEQVFLNGPRYRYIERGHRRGDDVYAAKGRTDRGRNLIVFFVHKRLTRDALILSARSPSRRERNV